MFSDCPFGDPSSQEPESGSGGRVAEDFLRIKVVSLVLILVFSLFKQPATRFALPEKSKNESALPDDQVESMKSCQLPEPGAGLFAVFDGKACESLEQLIATVESAINREGNELPVLITASRDRTIGEWERVKDVFLDRGIEVNFEFEVRNE